MPLFDAYLTVLRPCVSAAGPPCDSDPLWLSVEGRKEENIGRHVSKFFQKHLQLNITTTVIRTVVETTSHQLLVEGTYYIQLLLSLATQWCNACVVVYLNLLGVITRAQRDAITEVNTHTSAIAREHYVRTNLSRTVHLARQAFAGGAEVAAPTPAPAATPEVWGVDHPDGASVERAMWTVAEKQYLLKVYTRLYNDSTKNRIFSLCLKAVRADPATRAIFHVRHVASTDRLKSGLNFKAMGYNL